MNQQRGDEILHHVSTAVEKLVAAKPMLDTMVHLVACLCDAEEGLVASPDAFTWGREAGKVLCEEYHTAKEARTIISRHIQEIVDETVRCRMAVAAHYGKHSFWVFLGEGWLLGDGRLLELSRQRFTELQTNTDLAPLSPAELTAFQQSHAHHQLFQRCGRILVDINNEVLRELEEPIQHETKIILENGDEPSERYISIGSLKHAISECKDFLAVGLKLFCEDLHLPPPENTEEARWYRVSLHQHHLAVMDWALHLAKDPGHRVNHI